MYTLAMSAPIQRALFEAAGQSYESAADAPLATRMRPRTLDEFVGQAHLIGPGRALRRAVEQDRVASIILWGPPGTGKTTLALLIARAAQAHFTAMSAVTEGVAEVRRVIDDARRRRQAGQRTILLVDEVHRWSKAQQDALLPHLESGLITLIGVTTENPYFDVIAPLRSRLRIFKLEPLTEENIRQVVQRALDDSDRGLGRSRVRLASDALEQLVALSAGDARVALNTLEAAADAMDGLTAVFGSPSPIRTERELQRQAGGARGRAQAHGAGTGATVALENGGEAGAEEISAEAIVEAAQRRQVRYDRGGDDHYQTASAFIKSLRGSDPDAAVLWLAKMLAAGEDPRFIARRLVIVASEDVGNADPQGLVVATAAADAVERIGMPESGLILAQATTYLASAPKSNASAQALWAAEEAVASGANLEVPLHLRNASFGGARGLGYGRGYRYLHDYPANSPERYAQRHLPNDFPARRLYEPTESGHEATIRRRLEQARRLREGLAPDPALGDAP